MTPRKTKYFLEKKVFLFCFSVFFSRFSIFYVESDTKRLFVVPVAPLVRCVAYIVWKTVIGIRNENFNIVMVEREVVAWGIHDWKTTSS